MSINPESLYPGKIAPSSASYPYGQARNITVPGDGTGTPWEAALVNDVFGLLQGLLSEAGVVPSGSPDTALVSQYRTALNFTKGKVVADYAAVKALTTSELKDGTKVFIMDSKRGGEFIWDESDYSTEVAYDTLEGIYIPPTSDATGASGAYVRIRVNSREVIPEWFGAVGDGATDDTAALQAALDVNPNNAGSYAPGKASGGEGRVDIRLSANYRTTSALDCSQRDYVRIVGNGRATLTANHSSYVIDMSSADHCEFAGFRISSSTAVIGIYLNRCTTNPYAMFNKIRNVTIVLGTSTTANSNIGTIGIFNCRGEQNLYENLEIRTDVPYLARSTNSSIGPLFGTQDTVIVSESVNKHDQCNFIKNGPQNFAMILAGALSLEFINCYWGMAAINTGSNEYAVQLDGVNRCKFSGSVETMARFAQCKQDNFQNDIDIVMQVGAVDANGIINMDNSGATAGYLDGEVRVLVAGGTPAVGACIFKDSGTSTTVKIIGNIIKTTSLMIPITDVGGRSISRNIIQTDSTFAIDTVAISSVTADLTPAGDTLYNLGSLASRFARVFANRLHCGPADADVFIISGSGTPEGAVTADRGSLYMRTDGGASTSFYVKESGDGTNTGWVAK